MTTRKTRLYNIYKEHQKAQIYLLGCVYKGNLYACFMESIPPRMIQCTKRGLQMRPYTERDKRYIAKHGTCLGKANLLDSDTYNKGRMFEQVVYALYGQAWTLENTPFYEDGDITINEVKVQIKYNRGHIAYNTTLERLASR